MANYKINGVLILVILFLKLMISAMPAAITASHTTLITYYELLNYYDL